MQQSPETAHPEEPAGSAPLTGNHRRREILASPRARGYGYALPNSTPSLAGQIAVIAHETCVGEVVNRPPADDRGWHTTGFNARCRSTIGRCPDPIATIQNLRRMMSMRKRGQVITKGKKTTW